MVIESPTKAMRATPSAGLSAISGSAQAAAVGPDIDAHQLGLGLRSMAMAKVGPRVAHLHLARVLPHFELVQHAVVENEAGKALHSEQTQK